MHRCLRFTSRLPFTFAEKRNTNTALFSRLFHTNAFHRARKDDVAEEHADTKFKMTEGLEEHIKAQQKRREELHKDMFSSGKGSSNEFRFLTQLEEKYELFNKLKTSHKELLTTINDPNEDEEMKQLAREELSTVLASMISSESELVTTLVQNEIEKEQESGDRNALIELRPGTGGDEAALWNMELFLMYQKYAESKGWKFEIAYMQLGANPSSLREGIATVSGEDVYGRLRHESGVHRVQRVPATETQGRVHTSTCSVVVLPELEETEVKINPSDLKIDTYRSSGAGGQHVNVTDSAVRITHLPTGMQVAISDERSQLQNKLRAMSILRARLHEIDRKKKESERKAQRNEQIGGGDRSDKIRTYNFSQDRITDHRVGVSLFDIDAMLEGELLDEFIDAMNEKEVVDAYERLVTRYKVASATSDKKKKK